MQSDRFALVGSPPVGVFLLAFCVLASEFKVILSSLSFGNSRYLSESHPAVLKSYEFVLFVCVVALKCFPPSLSGVVEGDLSAVEAYKSSGGDIARQLNADEVRILNRPSAFDAGFTLVHLAIRFQRQDMLAVLLTEVRVLHVRCEAILQRELY